MIALKGHLYPFLGLIGLLALTVLSAFLPLGPANIWVSTVISVCKAWIIYTFFMELREAGTIIRVFALLGVIWLVVMLSLAGTDYLSRWPGTLQRG